MDREPSASGLTIVSKKGMDPSSLLSSTVNLMAGSKTVYVLEEALFVGFLVNDKGVIHIPVTSKQLFTLNCLLTNQLPNIFPLHRLTVNTFHPQIQLVLNTSYQFSFQLPLGLTLFILFRLLITSSFNTFSTS